MSPRAAARRIQGQTEIGAAGTLSGEGEDRCADAPEHRRLPGRGRWGTGFERGARLAELPVAGRENAPMKATSSAHCQTEDQHLPRMQVDGGAIGISSDRHLADRRRDLRRDRLGCCGLLGRGGAACRSQAERENAETNAASCAVHRMPYPCRQSRLFRSDASGNASPPTRRYTSALKG